MDLRHLRYFLAIAESRSISVAAHTIGVAQPSLSQHLRRMEEELGVRLVERSPRGTMLTEEGQVLVEHARRICGMLDACVEEMRNLSGEVKGTVAFGIPPSAAMAMSVPLAETVRLELPHVRLRAIESMSTYIKSWIDDRTVDLAIVYDLENADHLRATHLVNEELHFISAPDSWPFDTDPGTPVPFKALEAVEMILPSNGLRRTIERYAEAHGVTLNVVMDMDAMTQIKELVARGSGYAIFAPAATQDLVARGELVRARIIDPVLIRPVHLVNHRDVVLSRAGRAVEAITLKVVHELVSRGLWEGSLP
ncbi:LysR family transcriptional regulator [Acuticoccus sediminis]|uniref:LysR family transcriptional regulator n=1 Tax=Acuticoccus sediminis TaxID=2184697 RepID=A0A8B2NL87_9HYPH|nr:LysR family transcriptional regulator [Acuticoccus sediminis]RAH99310.1 LysR family transcriptional regulator [Acuticoccus sediminis]